MGIHHGNPAEPCCNPATREEIEILEASADTVTPCGRCRCVPSAWRLVAKNMEEAGAQWESWNGEFFLYNRRTLFVDTGVGSSNCLWQSDSGKESELLEPVDWIFGYGTWTITLGLAGESFRGWGARPDTDKALGWVLRYEHELDEAGEVSRELVPFRCLGSNRLCYWEELMFGSPDCSDDRPKATVEPWYG